MSIKDMIVRCIERMRGGACATCDNRSICPAGRWQAFSNDPAGTGTGSHSAGVLGALADAVQKLVLPASPKRCFKKDVEDVIEPMLGAHEVSIEHVARRLGMSRQTLYRRLRDEGVTFEEILEAKRRQLAIRFLGLEQLSVKAVAYKLGFSDPAAFSRAFKRWTGVSPSRFRPL